MSAVLRNGYKVRNISSIDDEYKCCSCKCLLRDPVRLDCKHSICHSCIRSDDTVIRCDKCLQTSISTEVKRHETLSKDMQALRIECFDCKWSGSLKDYQNHLVHSHKDGQSLLHHKSQTACELPNTSCLLEPYGCSAKFAPGDRTEHYLSKDHQETASERLKSILRSTSAPIPMTTNECAEEQNSIANTIEIFAKTREIIQEDRQRIRAGLSQQLESVEKIASDTALLKTSVEATENELNALLLNMSILREQFRSFKERATDLQSVSYDGTTIWKILGVCEKIQDALSERQTSIYSSPFFSSPTGYKMCARLYFNGDGNARRTHISLFFVLMQGPHDSLLQFPFSYKVTFCLFDQSGAQRHIIDSFRPDPKSNSFQRPQGLMNIASGIPKFAPLEMITKEGTSYVKNDTMFIRIAVDFDNLPRKMVLYGLSLNPALPMHFQQRMIAEEMQRMGSELAEPTPATSIVKPVIKS